MDELLDTGQAATALGLSVRRVQRLAQEGRLEPLRYVRGSPIFTREAVDAFRAIPRKPGRPRKPAAGPRGCEEGADGDRD